MAIDKRPPEKLTKTGIGTGPYLGKVISHLDPSFMSGLEVTLLRDQANEQGEDSQTYFVRYLTPFYGSTAYEFMGTNKDNDQSFNDTQKSYGMWFVPPDIGVTVMVVFVDGNPSEGYFIGCVPSRFANNMIPAIGGTDKVDISPADKKKYATSQPLPVAEVNRKANDLANSTAIDKLKRPVHPIADRFLEQGLLEDDVRGVTPSTVRRDVPNMVFGILSPGPLDKRPGAKRSFIGRSQSKTSSPVPVSRLGGTQLVMDDGDDRYQRKKPASEGPVDYADILNGEKGDVNIPYNEHFRIRTRTGHQLLLHNSEDLIYIGNARGTTWIELTSNGKIDIFSEDSISIHTKNDFNFRADRDINLEAGRNINIKASADYSKATPTDLNGKIKDAKGFESGRIQIESAFNFNLLIGANGKIQTRTYKDAGGADQDGHLEISVEGHTKIETGTGVNKPHDFEVLTTGSNNLTALVSTNILSTVGHFETAGVIHMNGPPATPAISPTDVEKTNPPSIIKPLTVFDNISTDKSLVWADTKYFSENAVKSIMKRIPMHEPWPIHENQAPEFVNPDFTDRELE